MLTQILLQAKDAEGGGSPYSSLIMFGLIILVFYFFMIRPQLKKSKESKKFRQGLRKDDKVVTVGGVYGKVTEVKESAVIIEIADNVRIKVEKSAVSAEYSGQLDKQKK